MCEYKQQTYNNTISVAYLISDIRITKDSASCSQMLHTFIFPTVSSNLMDIEWQLILRETGWRKVMWAARTAREFIGAISFCMILHSRVIKYSARCSETYYAYNLLRIGHKLSLYMLVSFIY